MQNPAPALPASSSWFWVDAFEPFGKVHVVTALGCLFIVAVLCIAGRLTWPGEFERRARFVGGVVALLIWIVYQAWWMIPPRLDMTKSLPLHLCDIAGLLAPITLFIEARAPRGVLYFWAMVLTTQGFVTPTVRVGPNYLEYWFFWCTHAVIVGTAVYDLVVRRFEPTLGDLVVTTLASLLYAAVMFVFDIATGYNYGYVGNTTPANPTLIDRLGPWPLRVLWLILIGHAGFVIAYIPWAVVAYRRLRSIPAESEH